MSLCPTRKFARHAWMTLLHIHQCLHEKTSCAAGWIDNDIFPLYVHQANAGFYYLMWSKKLTFPLLECCGPQYLKR